MESNKTYHFLFKYGLLFGGILFLCVPVISWIAPNAVEFNGETGTIDLTTSLLFGLIGIIPILFFFLLKDKFVIVEIDNQTVKIKQNGQVKTVTWMDIDSLTQIQFVYPPLYKLKIKDNKETVWFNTRNKFISVNGFTTDISEMGDLINKKKRDLGI